MPPRSLLLLACLAVPAAPALAQSPPDSAAAGSRRERIAPWRFELSPRIRVNPHREPWAFRMREEALRFRADELRWRALERGRAVRERSRDLLERRLHERLHARRDLAMRRLDERLRSMHDRRRYRPI